MNEFSSKKAVKRTIFHSHPPKNLFKFEKFQKFAIIKYLCQIVDFLTIKFCNKTAINYEFLMHNINNSLLNVGFNLALNHFN